MSAHKQVSYEAKVTRLAGVAKEKTEALKLPRSGIGGGHLINLLQGIFLQRSFQVLSTTNISFPWFSARRCPHTVGLGGHNNVALAILVRYRNLPPSLRAVHKTCRWESGLFGSFIE